MILAAAPLIGYFIGHWIDKRAGTDPWFMLVFLVLGLVAGARETILIIKKAQEDDRDENP
jgi:ATP synthase protein I